MSRFLCATAALALAIAAGPAAAQSWGFGVELGTPVYGPPPVYYQYAEPPYYAAEPPVYYGTPPVVVVPRERRVLRIVSPDRVLDRLDAEGYRELGPMRRRGSIYSLSAVAPEGDVVALEVSAVTGEIEREFVLEPARKKPARAAEATKRVRTAAAPKPKPQVEAPPPAAAQAPAPAGEAPTALRDRLQPIPPVEEAPTEGDPLVVY